MVVSKSISHISLEKLVALCPTYPAPMPTIVRTKVDVVYSKSTEKLY